MFYCFVVVISFFRYGIKEIILKSLTKKISDEEFCKFWETLNITIVELDVDDPILQRQRKLPKRFDESSSPHYHQTPKKCIM